MAPNHHHHNHPIPNLFPDSLQASCTNTILNNLISSGRRIENDARWMVSCGRDQSDSINFVKTDYFNECVNVSREFLVSFLASHLLDSLAESLAIPTGPGCIFCFSVLCNDRLSKLNVYQHNQHLLQQQYLQDHHIQQPSFWETPLTSGLLLECLGQLRCLSSLTIQHVCTNDLLFTVANTCSRLQILDISFSSQVGDLGLVYLCGVASTSWTGGFDQFKLNTVRGCKYLREIYFDPKSDKPPPDGVSVMPRVISYLLRHLDQLQVADLENLHAGIEYYYRGGQDGSYRPRPARIAPLKLRFYTGSDDKLASIIPICPKLCNFKLYVTEALTALSDVLKSSSNSLDKVSLVFGPSHDAILQNPVHEAQVSEPLPGLVAFLQSCGNRINSLEIDLSSNPAHLIGLDDLKVISEQCPLLENLTFTRFHLDQRPEHVPSVPLKFNFLASLKLTDVCIENCGRELFLYLLGGCPELETLTLAFASTTFFFNDFLLDDILILNSFGRLEHFILSEVSLTLISALRMISSRPKLCSIGHLLQWDVEESELEAFAQILRRAKSLNLLQDITIL